MNPLCASCEKTIPKAKSGIVVAELFGQPPKPYKLWHADLYVCDGCGCRVVSGWAERAFAEHFQSDFSEIWTKNPPTVYWFESKGDAHDKQP